MGWRNLSDYVNIVKVLALMLNSQIFITLIQ